MMYLLDVSTLLALLWENHVNHSRVRAWESEEQIAVCPITELGFLRISTHAFNATMEDARRSLSTWLARRKPQFVACGPHPKQITNITNSLHFLSTPKPQFPTPNMKVANYGQRRDPSGVPPLLLPTAPPIR